MLVSVILVAAEFYVLFLCCVGYLLHLCECLCFHLIGQFIIPYPLCDWSVLHFYLVFFVIPLAVYKRADQGTVIDSDILTHFSLHYLVDAF